MRIAYSAKRKVGKIGFTCIEMSSILYRINESQMLTESLDLDEVKNLSIGSYSKELVDMFKANTSRHCTIFIFSILNFVMAKSNILFYEK